MNKSLPIALFVTFALAVLAATFYYAPSWGLMDDYQNVKMASDIWSSPQPLHLLADNFMGAGMFRPVYFSWIALFYYIFQNWPTGFYAFNTVFNMAALIFWGIALFHLFQVRKQDYFWTVFFYPLTFFIFTAFWNIFNYISLQEKLIVFFAPLAIYFFQKSYRDDRPGFLLWACVFLLFGLFSKATFLFVPAIFIAYAVLDLVLFHYRPRISWLALFVNGIIFAGYALFTVAVQLNQTYTEKYKANLGAGAFLERIVLMSLVMKLMLIVGIVGTVSVIVYSIRSKRPEFSLSILVYLGLTAFVVLLLPWGSQSYLLSAAGPLFLGALFPVYDWFCRRHQRLKQAVRGIVILMLVAIFFGNIIPNVARMADIGGAMEFLREYQKAGAQQDYYFMPPPFSESAYATGKFTGKNVLFCGDGSIKEDLLAADGENYVIFNDMFPSIRLVGVRITEPVFSNSTWRIFKLTRDKTHQEDFLVAFPKNFIQRLKIRIRNMS